MDQESLRILRALFIGEVPARRDPGNFPRTRLRDPIDRHVWSYPLVVSDVRHVEAAPLPTRTGPGVHVLPVDRHCTDDRVGLKAPRGVEGIELGPPLGVIVGEPPPRSTSRGRQPRRLVQDGRGDLGHQDRSTRIGAGCAKGDGKTSN